MADYPSPYSYLGSLGGTLNGIDWVGPVDLTDGSWTLVDTDSVVQSVTHSGGFNTVTWNEFNPSAQSATGQTHNWQTNAAKNGARWYKNLLIDGVQPNARDYILFNTLMKIDVAVNELSQQVVAGACIDPTSFERTVILGAGGFASKAINSAAAYGVWTNSSASTSSAGTPDGGTSSTFRGGGATGSGVYHTFDQGSNPPTTRQVGSRNTNLYDIPSATLVKLMVGIGVANNTEVVSAGDRQSFRLSYNAVKLTI